MRNLWLATAVSLILASPAYAQQEPISPQPALDKIERPVINEEYTATMLDLNKTKASQRRFAQGTDILKRRLLDKNNTTIGKVTDVLIGPDATLQTIQAEVDTGFREEMSFNVKSFITNPTPDTYTIGLDKKQIKQNQDELLAQVETAAGEDAPVSLHGLIGSNIEKEDRAIIGKVTDALIDDKTGIVSALVVTVQIGNNRGASIAIPYDPTTVSVEGGKPQVVVTNQQAQIIASLPTRR